MSTLNRYYDATIIRDLSVFSKVKNISIIKIYEREHFVFHKIP